MVEDRTEENIPFSMVESTLERVNGILAKLTEISISCNDYIMRCYIKSKLAEELYQTSFPLINNKTEFIKIKKRIDNLKNEFVRKKNVTNYKNRGQTICYIDTEEKIRNIILDILSELGKDNYFRASKKDLKLGQI